MSEDRRDSETAEVDQCWSVVVGMGQWWSEVGAGVKYDLSRFRVSPILTHSRFRRFSMCVSAVAGVSLIGISLLSADVAFAMVRPEVISQRVFISRGRTRAH